MARVKARTLNAFLQFCRITSRDLQDDATAGAYTRRCKVCGGPHWRSAAVVVCRPGLSSTWKLSTM